MSRLILTLWFSLLALGLPHCARRRAGVPAPTMIPNPVAGNAENSDGTACARYSVCCQQLVAASAPGSVAAQPACAQLAILSAMGPQGDRACEQGLMQVRASIAASSATLPQACAQPGGVAWNGQAPRAGAPATLGRGTVVGVGTLTSGSLESSDLHLPDGAVGDDYAIALTGGRTVTIVVRGGASRTTPGSDLDVFTIVMQNGVEIVHDDDSAGSLNSRIIFTAPTSGLYTIRVTTYGGSLKEGSYTLQTYEGALGSQS